MVAVAGVAGKAAQADNPKDTPGPLSAAPLLDGMVADAELTKDSAGMSEPPSRHLRLHHSLYDSETDDIAVQDASINTRGATKGNYSDTDSMPSLVSDSASNESETSDTADSAEDSAGVSRLLVHHTHFDADYDFSLFCRCCSNLRVHRERMSLERLKDEHMREVQRTRNQYIKTIQSMSDLRFED